MYPAAAKRESRMHTVVEQNAVSLTAQFPLQVFTLRTIGVPSRRNNNNNNYKRLRVTLAGYWTGAIPRPQGVVSSKYIQV